MNQDTIDTPENDDVSPAALRWRVRAAERNIAGTCVDCDSKAIPGKGRCQEHHERNLKRVQDFHRRNPEYLHQQWLQVLERRKQGICKCSFPIDEPGFARCSLCRQAQSSDPEVRRRAAKAKKIRRLAKTMAKAARAAEVLPPPVDPHTRSIKSWETRRRNQRQGTSP